MLDKEPIQPRGPDHTGHYRWLNELIAEHLMGYVRSGVKTMTYEYMGSTMVVQGEGWIDPNGKEGWDVAIPYYVNNAYEEIYACRLLNFRLGFLDKYGKPIS